MAVSPSTPCRGEGAASQLTLVSWDRLWPQSPDAVEDQLACCCCGSARGAGGRGDFPPLWGGGKGCTGEARGRLKIKVFKDKNSDFIPRISFGVGLLGESVVYSTPLYTHIHPGQNVYFGELLNLYDGLNFLRCRKGGTDVRRAVWGTSAHGNRV